MYRESIIYTTTIHLIQEGDYDGDQTTVKAAYTIEANKELSEHINKKSHYVSLGGLNGRTSTKEAIQSLYNLTLILPDTKLTEPIF